MSSVSEAPTPSESQHLVREDWDNHCHLDLDVDESKPKDISICGILCENKSDCVQYAVFEGKCKYSDTVRLGSKTEKYGKDRKTAKSGWMKDRVEKLHQALDGCSRNGEGKEKWIL
jgi:hypothetical protein